MHVCGVLPNRYWDQVLSRGLTSTSSGVADVSALHTCIQEMRTLDELDTEKTVFPPMSHYSDAPKLIGIAVSDPERDTGMPFHTSFKMAHKQGFPFPTVQNEDKEHGA
jgi:hypothetical protein